MNKRPEHVLCIQHPYETWSALCGRSSLATEAHFVGMGHWLTNSMNGGRYVGCPGCLKVIRGALVREGAVDAT